MGLWKRTAAMACVALAAYAVSPQAAQADGKWEKLGQRIVNFRADRDTIPVTAAEGRFKKIRIHVKGNGVRIMDLKVHFRNGQTQDVAIRAHIPAGGTSRVIDLPGEARIIRSITMTYKTRGVRRGRATVAVWGKHAGIAAAPVPPPPPVVTPPTPPVVVNPLAGWTRLGVRNVRWGADRDVIPVTIADGIFRRVKIHVKGRRVHMMDMKIHFGNGQVQDVQLRKAFPPGTWSRVIDLPGKGRVIRKVVFWYKKAVVARPGKAQVVLWGKH